MPKNTKGGKKGKKGKKGGGISDAKLVVAEEGQIYAKALKLVGGKFISVLCSDDKTRIGVICGKMRTRRWIKEGDILLVSLRPSTGEDNKCDIIGLYTPQQAKKLLNDGQIKFQVKEEEAEEEKKKSGIKFKDEQDDDDDDDDDSDPFGKLKKNSNQKAVPLKSKDGDKDTESIDFDDI